ELAWRTEERAMDRVHVRIDDAAHEARALERRQRGAPGVRVGTERDQVAQLGRRGGLLRNAEEAPTPRGVARTDAAEHARERDGEEKRPDDRRDPPEVARVEPVEPGTPDAGDQRIEAVIPERLTPACLGLHPPRRTPGDRASEQVRQHEAGVEYHPDGREQA